MTFFAFRRAKSHEGTFCDHIEIEAEMKAAWKNTANVKSEVNIIDV